MTDSFGFGFLDPGSYRLPDVSAGNQTQDLCSGEQSSCVLFTAISTRGEGLINIKRQPLLKASC